MNFARVVLLLAAEGVLARGQTCPGAIDVPGHGRVSLIPTGWHMDAAALDVVDGTAVVPHMGARAYFAEECTAGTYDHKQYLALNLLGKTLRYTTDMSGSGCGCNAAFYLVSMRQNSNPSTCHDYYCDANSVCGVACAEIDIQEANQHAWHSTLHTSHDHSGVGVGYGGGDGWNGPRDFTSQQYGPGATCVDTSKPFDVAVSFPVNGQGTLLAMEVTLSQQGHSCPLEMKVNAYSGMAELSKALAEGMTPVISYWSDNGMLWMDGKGADGRGPCVADDASACTESVKFYGFSITSIGAPAPAQHAAPAPNGQGHSADSSDAGIQHGKAAPPLCPGRFDVRGYGAMSLVSARLNVPGQPAGRVQVQDHNAVVPHMKGRAYFGQSCTPGSYSNEQYVGLNLLGKTLRYTTDMSGAGCGCNAALYLVSMRQNERPSQCGDHYCDANNVCGESCAEIDIQEANQRAWHSTLHSAHDHGGLGAGYGGGSGWNGPRDFDARQYGPGAECIDTTKPFQVAVSFPIDAEDKLEAMEVLLSQPGHTCPLHLRIAEYAGMEELSRALAAGMTPVVSYWSADDMTWMDGQGADRLGPCASDNAALCPNSVKFLNFSIEEIGSAAPPPAGSPQAADRHRSRTNAASRAASRFEERQRGGATCPGSFDVDGYGEVSLVPTGWHANGKPVEVLGRSKLVPHMDSRAYFANECTAGTYDHRQYLALNLLGKTLRYTTDLSGAGCGCNAALYLVSMRQNPRPSSCHDFYCDANNVCGESCAEIDIQEANQYAWHSTLHTSHDHGGKGAGFGGGQGWNGPRDFTAEQYSPGGRCIDTSKPFQVAASFPVDASGTLKGMDVVLSQDGRSCPLRAAVDDYSGMAELSRALEAGMTPVMSYWSANDMLWMDGVGADGAGPCAKDDAAACAELVHFYDFSVSEIIGQDASAAASTRREEAGAARSSGCAGKYEDCRSKPCCGAPAMTCHKDSQWWSSCRPQETLHETLIGLQEQVITDCPGGKKGNCSSATTGTSSSKSAVGGADHVQVLVSVKASDVPPTWGQGKEILIGAEHHQIQGEVVRMTGVPGAAAARDAPEPAAAAAVKEDTDAVALTTTRVVLIALVALVITAIIFRKVGMTCTPVASWWQRSVHAITTAKTHFQMNKATGTTSARPLSLRLGESPVRRRKGDGGVGQAPQEAAVHPRWPSDNQVSPQVNTPGRWPLMS